MAASGNSSGGGDDPMAWLGLLKWSLNYVDGTKPVGEGDNSPPPMSDEDRAFLEKVMKEGIIDENERMKFILEEATKAIEFYNSEEAEDGEATAKTTENLEELLQELRDIVEQIDYAKAFCSLKGLPFLLGCIMAGSKQDKSNIKIPLSIRTQCAAILSTLAQNNPSVQKELLELGALGKLSDVFFRQDTLVALKGKLMQAISCIVRNNALAEGVFSNLEQAPLLLLEGLQINKTHDYTQNPAQLESKTLFFLKALLTSDESTSERVQKFQTSVIYVADHYLIVESESMKLSGDLREMAISMIEQLLHRELLDSTILSKERKDALIGRAVKRISQVRQMADDSDEKEYALPELENWETFLVVLSRK